MPVFDDYPHGERLQIHDGRVAFCDSADPENGIFWKVKPTRESVDETAAPIALAELLRAAPTERPFIIDTTEAVLRATHEVTLSILDAFARDPQASADERAAAAERFKRVQYALDDLTRDFVKVAVELDLM